MEYFLLNPDSIRVLSSTWRISWRVKVKGFFNLKKIDSTRRDTFYQIKQISSLPFINMQAI